MADSPFWEFSLRFYACEGVAQACLQLQDEGGADVNVLLYLLFLAEQRLLAGRRDVEILDACVALWREQTVRPLREMRRRLKQQSDIASAAQQETFRNRIKKVELEAEKLQQLALEREGAKLRLASAPAREEAAQLNINAYIAHLGGLPGNAVKTVLMAFTLSPPSYPGGNPI